MRHSKAALRSRHLHVAHFTLMDDVSRQQRNDGPDQAKVYSTARYSQPSAPGGVFAEMLAELARREPEERTRRPECLLAGRWGFLAR